MSFMKNPLVSPLGWALSQNKKQTPQPTNRTVFNPTAPTQDSTGSMVGKAGRNLY